MNEGPGWVPSQRPDPPDRRDRPGHSGPGEPASPGPGYGPPGPSAIRLVGVFPDLLSTYGDRGNLLVLARRARLRGLPVEIAEVNSDQRVPVDGDIYLLGGGEDLPQILAAAAWRAAAGCPRPQAAAR